jgi:hypothetical protein
VVVRILLARASALSDLYWEISQGERRSGTRTVPQAWNERYRFCCDHLAFSTPLQRLLAVTSRQQALLGTLEREVAKAFMGD